MHQAQQSTGQSRTFRRTGLGLLLITAALAASAGLCRAQEYLTGIEWQKPPIITPGRPSTRMGPGVPPSDAVVLFNGKDFSAWKDAETWTIEDGAMVVGTNYIETKEHFGDCQLHVEWMAPTPPKGSSQGRGNSGVFFGPYELQVLDSYDNETYFDGQAAAIYKQHPPMVNAMRPPGEWNVYDIVWTAPRFKEDGKLQSPAYSTVFHNGVVVQNHFELLGDTPFHRPPQYNPPTEQPIRLQDHGNPVKFRNIWVREIKPIEGKKTREPFMRIGDKEIPLETAQGATVSGRVTVDGKALSRGKIVLHAEGDARDHSASVINGVYEFNGKVKPGMYTVTVHAAENKEAEFSTKYSDKNTSGLTIETTGGDIELNFDLTSE